MNLVGKVPGLTEILASCVLISEKTEMADLMMEGIDEISLLTSRLVTGSKLSSRNTLSTGAFGKHDCKLLDARAI